METIYCGYISGERKQLHYKALIAKPLKHPCFASWMSNNKHSTPESWDELYINQWVIKCNIWFQILPSASRPDLFICWNTSKLYQLELLPPSQHLEFTTFKNDVIWRLFISKCQQLWFSQHAVKPHVPLALVQPVLRTLGASIVHRYILTSVIFGRETKTCSI